MNPVNGWHWKLNDGEDSHCLELYDADGEMLAFIHSRPPYCDAGHYSLMILQRSELRHYMDLEVAMWEAVELLVWHMHQVSYQQHKGGIKTFMKEEAPGGRLYITDVEHRSTVAPSRKYPGHSDQASRAGDTFENAEFYSDKLAEPYDATKVRRVEIIYEIGSPDPMTYPPTEQVHQHQERVEEAAEAWKADRAKQIRELLKQPYTGFTQSAFLVSFKRPDGTSAIIDEHEAKAAGMWEEVQQAMRLLGKTECVEPRDQELEDA